MKYHDEWITKSDGGWYMLNPGIPEVRKLIVNEVSYIVKKYKVNIHVDDYFYPYPPYKDLKLVFHNESEFLK